MMRNLLIIITAAALVFSCQQDEPATPEDFGYLALGITMEIESEPASGRISTVNTDDFKVTIFRADGTEYQVINPFSSVPPEVQLPTGVYYVEAHSNDLVEAAFDSPYYFAKSDTFSIDKEELKTIDVEAKLANAKVAINFSTEVTNLFDTYSGQVEVVSSGTTLSYMQGETREGYFVVEPLAVEVYLSYTKLDGTTIDRTFNASIDDPQPATLYNINVDATLEDGAIVFNLTVDEGVDTVNINLGDASSGPNADWQPGEDWVDTRDSTSYGTVQIGNQVWMSENLRYLPETQTEPQFKTAGIDGIPAYGVYNYFGSDVLIAKQDPNYEAYGVYYNWYASIDQSAPSETNPSGVQGACPVDWHLPSNEEWNQLFSNGGSDPAAYLMDESNGFEVVNTGIRTNHGYYTALAGTRWWTATEQFQYSAKNVGISDSVLISNVFSGKNFGFSIRCVKD